MFEVRIYFVFKYNLLYGFSYVKKILVLNKNFRNFPREDAGLVSSLLMFIETNV